MFVVGWLVVFYYGVGALFVVYCWQTACLNFWF